jgi:hypothetical protein
VRVSGTQSCMGCRWYGVVVVMMILRSQPAVRS